MSGSRCRHKYGDQDLYSRLPYLGDRESLVMGMQWHTSLVGEQSGDSVRMVNIDTFGTKLFNPLESPEDKAVEDNLDDSTIEVYPESKIERAS